ncbi:hypothetical protein TRFO_28633 [Tritrichomonas foetus]|uniref:E2F/DP family winged-helix DNA-binding domain-containing protein n=1 Tax=Tritrichomonas foetus TaxID=1144522 RepID=A0A1J4JXT7_9EUKA|nr:hypothetical protein TRFO_28633 [Tritrichomonas foetus]|eukprot:OHT03975.1 hypothetical protein TRFO_28633 [Tritrichomonas foetus]
MEKKKSNQSRSKRRNDFSDFIDQLIHKYEDAPDPNIQINALSMENNVEKRRLYDLLNVLVACSVCTKTDSHTYKWNSIHNTKEAIKKISLELEARSLKETIEETFELPDSPSIGLITNRFIGVFLFFNLSTLNIRDVASLMACDESHYKPILRRLYLVAYLLERIGLFKHSQKIGEYQIDIDVRDICKNSLNNLAKADEFPPDSIEYQLNRFDDNYLDTIYNARRDVLVDVLRRGYRFQQSDASRVYMLNYHSIDI